MKKLKFIFVPVLAVGAILTTVYVIVNRESYSYQYDYMSMDTMPSFVTKAEGQLQPLADLEQADQLIKTNSKFVFYIGRQDCGDCEDLRTNVIPKLSNKNVPLFYLDGAQYRNDSKWNKEWYNLLGNYELGRDGDYLKNYRFTYTPTIGLVINGVMIETFWEFGGPGKDITTKEANISKYRTRYFRGGTIEQKEMGFNNAAYDIDALLNKWSKY